MGANAILNVRFGRRHRSPPEQPRYWRTEALSSLTGADPCWI